MPRYHPITPAQIDWADAIPQCRQHQDIYFSREGGIEESHHVFIQGNQQPQRWQNCASFTIAETGFGTGLNFLCTLALWSRQGPRQGRLHFISVEKHPLSADDLKRALAAFPALAPYADDLLASYPPLTHGLHRREFLDGRATLTLLFGDAADMFAELNARVDAWYLDGFAPGKNPEMWTDRLFQHMARLSKPDTSVATFSAAGVVKRGLKAAGFEVHTQIGFGRKRDMLVGRYTAEDNSHHPHPWFHCPQHTASTKNAVVIGGGLAGSSVSHALARRGWRITLIERHATIAQGASGNHSGVVMPRLTADMSRDGRFYLNAFLYTCHWLTRLRHKHPPLPWHDSGVLQLANSKTMQRLQSLQLPAEVLAFFDAAQATQKSGVHIGQDAIFFPGAGWLHPPALCRWLLDDQPNNINLIVNRQAMSLTKEKDVWKIWGGNHMIAEAETVIIANGHDAEQLLNTDIFTLQKVRGQIAYLPATDQSRQLKTPVCHDGYIVPAYQGRHCAGATYAPENESSQRTEEDDDEILRQLKKALPAFDGQPPIDGRVAFRTSTQDHLPIIGPVPDTAFYQQRYGDLRHGRPAHLYPNASYLDGMFISTGHGSRGLVSCPLAADTLAAMLNNEPIPLTEDLLNAVHPGRFLIRGFKQA